MDSTMAPVSLMVPQSDSYERVRRDLEEHFIFASHPLGLVLSLDVILVFLVELLGSSLFLCHLKQRHTCKIQMFLAHA